SLALIPCRKRCERLQAEDEAGFCETATEEKTRTAIQKTSARRSIVCAQPVIIRALKGSTPVHALASCMRSKRPGHPSGAALRQYSMKYGERTLHKNHAECASIIAP